MAVNRERRIILKEVDCLDSFEGETLGDILVRVQEYVARYGASAVLMRQYYQYDDGSYLAIMQKALETDEQLASRIASEEKFEAESYARDLAQYNKLRDKFGDV
jgi:hypothetical protein